MIWFYRIFDFYIQASIHVALAVVSLFLVSCKILNISPGSDATVLVFLGSVGCYNFIKYGFEYHKYAARHAWYRRIIGSMSILCCLVAFYLLFTFNTQVWGLMAVLLIMVSLYALPIFPREKNLRSLGILKVFLVALTWTGITVCFPVVAYKYPWNWDVFVLGLQHFFFVIALMIPFEIRDMHYDPPQIKTLPRRIGVVATKWLGIILLLLILLLTFFKDELHPGEGWTRAAVFGPAAILIWNTPVKPSVYYAAFWVEAIPIFWIGLYVLYDLWV